MEIVEVLCKVTYTQKNPHIYTVYNVHKYVDSVDNLHSQEVFPDFYNVPSAHSYQQITRIAIF